VSVATLLSIPDSMFFRVTVALGIPWPLGSVMVPRKEVEDVWENTRWLKVRSNSDKNSANRCRHFISYLLPGYFSGHG